MTLSFHNLKMFNWKYNTVAQCHSQSGPLSYPVPGDRKGPRDLFFVIGAQRQKTKIENTYLS